MWNLEVANQTEKRKPSKQCSSLLAWHYNFIMTHTGKYGSL